MPVGVIKPNLLSPIFGYIHPDHLDTPRLIANATPATVWRWDNDDPFGGNMANSNPSGLGTFAFNLRFPGQYFDSETNNHYNYYRDYSPEIGRYIESDPIGLDGGPNTYAYVASDPMSRTAPKGLESGWPWVYNPSWGSPSGASPICTDDCENPVTISSRGVCRAGDVLCGEAMKAAGISPPYYPETKTYSGTCLLKIGIGVKATSTIGSTVVLNKLAAASAKWARVAAVANNPITIVVSASFAADAVLKQCECKAPNKLRDQP